MDESEDNMSADDSIKLDGSSAVKNKPKKRSLVERELETNLTARVTSPVTSGDGSSTSRYGRARRLKSEVEYIDPEKSAMKTLVSPKFENSPIKTQSPVYKMHASNSPIKIESPKRIISVETNLENQIENIYHENISLSRFGSEEKKSTKYPKVYVRKDLIQKREKDETVTLIKNMFSPVKSSSSHLNNILERSSEKYTINSSSKAQNGYSNTLSVVKTLDFDGTKKKKKDGKDNKGVLSKNELFELEAKSEYQVGDLAWARMGTFPFWPCIITRDPLSGMFVKKKLFGRIERDVLHVTFFGDNGRRSWIVDSMLKKYLGLGDFEMTRAQFTPEAKKKDPRLYAAYFVSEKKLPQWTISVEEAEMLLREPKRIRIDVLYDMLQKSRAMKSTPKAQKSSKVTRTDSDVSLSESLYDTLFSEDDGKADDTERSRKKSKNKSLDVSEVVTACLDNMAAKTGITKIQRQSHMDRWLQKAKSKTPEKSQKKSKPVQVVEKEIKSNSSKKKKVPTKTVQTIKPYSLRKSNESQNLFSHQNEHDYSSQYSDTLGSSIDKSDTLNESVSFINSNTDDSGSGIGIIAKVESLRDKIDGNDVNLSIAENVDNEVTEDRSSEAIVASNEVSETKLPNLDQDKNKVPLHGEKEVMCDSNEVTSTNNISELEEMGDMSSNTEQKSCESTVDSENIVNDESMDISDIMDQKDAECEVNNSLENNKSDNVMNNMSDLQSIVTSSSEELQKSMEYNEIIDNNSLPSSNIEAETILENRDIQDSINSVNNDESIIHISATNNQITLQNDRHKEESDITSNVAESNEMSVDEDLSDEVFLEAGSKGGNLVEDKVEEIIKDSVIVEPLEVADDIDLKDKNTEGDIIVEAPIVENTTLEIISQDASIELNDKDDNITDQVSTEVLPNDVESDTTTCFPNGSGEDSAVEECQTDSVNDSVIDDNVINNEEEIVCNDDEMRENVEDSEINDQNTEIDLADRELEKLEESTNEASVETNEILSSEACIENGIFSEKDTDIDTDINNDVDSETVSLNSNCSEIVQNKLKNIEHTSETDAIIVNGVDQETQNNDSEKINFDLAPKENLPIETMTNGFTSDQDINLELNENNFDSETASLNSEDTGLSDEQLKNDNLNVKVADLNSINLEISSKNSYEKDEIDKNIENLVPIEVLSSETIIENGFNEGTEIDLEFNVKSNIDSNDQLNSKNSEAAEDKLINNDFINDIQMSELESTNIDQSNTNNTDKNIIDPVPNEILLSPTVTNGYPESCDFDSETASISSENGVKLSKSRKSLSLVKNNLNKSIENNLSTEKKDIDDDDTGSVNSEISESSLLKRRLQVTLSKLPDLTVKRVQNDKQTDTDDEKFDDAETASINSEDSENIPLARRILRSKMVNKIVKENGYHHSRESTPDRKIKDELDAETASINSEDSEVSVSRRRRKDKKVDDASKALEDPEFVKYLELRQDALIDDNPQLTQDEIVNYLYKTWLYEESSKSDRKKTDDIENSNLVKGLNPEMTVQPKKIRRKVQKVEKEKEPTIDIRDFIVKDKPKRKTAQPYYNEDFSDMEDEIKIFEIFKPKSKAVVPKVEVPKVELPETVVKSEVQEFGDVQETVQEIVADEIDEVELYFEDLTKPKPNLFKGLIREKVCEYCEKTGNLVKCKSCHGMFHVNCVRKEPEVVSVVAPNRGRKKKKKPGRKPKSLDNSESQDDKMHDVSDETLNVSIEELIEPESRTVDAENFEAQLAEKMKELLGDTENMIYDSSDDENDWDDVPPGKCEIVDVKIKPKHEAIDHSNFKCKDCEINDPPICFVCKLAVSKTGVEVRQRCQVIHCHKYYHLECLDHWPQTQFNSGEPSRNNKKINEHFEALSCPRHVCHTCVSDDPRGCKTRFSGDKLARCVRCPATYHSFTKCLPAGTQILTGSHIICPRHYEHRPGKVPCHVNTGWCFICALGGSLICCEYCPTSFHAECLNIKPPEGGYMCEDCETGRLPLYGEMVWVKLGHYRWWPGIVLHPSEIPDNIMAVKHTLGEFVVRFFGQYDHYWVNRGRVFPFQEGDSGRISSQKSKIDAAFTTAMEHAQRACEILKAANPNEEECVDIASSLLPPHYVKLKVNKPCGSLRRLDVEESSLTQCDCDPNEDDVCGPYSHCLNRMLLTECGPICRAGERCNNRAFEKRLYPKLVPYRTPHRGWGLKTLEDIKSGQFVIEYVGELIDEEEFKRRMRRKHEIRDENFYFLTLDKERMIDAGPKGNLARFMNHCCEPNCETQKWTVLGDVRVGLFALYDIPANSEVTFNYNLECAGIEKKRCLCGAKRCSGYIGAKPKQDESHKKAKIPGKRAYKKRKNTEESPSTKNKPKRPIGRPAKPRELTEIEKDLLIIKNATNGISSDSESSSRLSSIDIDRKDHKSLKRKRVSFSTDESCYKNSPSTKKAKIDDEKCEVGD